MHECDYLNLGTYFCLSGLLFVACSTTEKKKVQKQVKGEEGFIFFRGEHVQGCKPGGLLSEV